SPAGAARVLPRAATRAALGAAHEGFVGRTAACGGRAERRRPHGAATPPPRGEAAAGTAAHLPGQPAEQPGVCAAGGRRRPTAWLLPGGTPCLPGGRPGVQLDDPPRLLPRLRADCRFPPCALLCVPGSLGCRRPRGAPLGALPGLAAGV